MKFMSRHTRIALCFAMGILVVAVGIYALLVQYYADGFGPNTWINGVYCTGKTVEAINTELIENTDVGSLVISFGGREYKIQPEEIDYHLDYSVALRGFQKKQNALLWVLAFRGQKGYQLEPTATFDSVKLKAIWDKLPFVKQEFEKEFVLKIYDTADGFQLYDGLHQRFNEEEAWNHLLEAVLAGKKEISLESENYFYDVVLTAEEEKLLELWTQMDAFQQCGLVYDMGDAKIPLSKGEMSAFLLQEEGKIALDASGELVLDRDAVTDFVNRLADTYDTYGTSRTFQSTRGDLIEVTGGTYGTLIDREAEITFLMENLLLPQLHAQKKVLHIPSYQREGLVHGKNDIGDTYIEIDMTDQKMYYYLDGSLQLETEVVTGNTGRHMGTPQGTFFVYAKQKNRVLRGADYSSFVKFWMPVKGAVGIHDASWRSKFGGEIYKTAGSHGCINTPTEKMKELYDLVEVGTPVIIFY